MSRHKTKVKVPVTSVGRDFYKVFDLVLIYIFIYLICLYCSILMWNVFASLLKSQSFKIFPFYYIRNHIQRGKWIMKENMTWFLSYCHHQSSWSVRWVRVFQDGFRSSWGEVPMFSRLSIRPCPLLSLLWWSIQQLRFFESVRTLCELPNRHWSHSVLRAKTWSNFWCTSPPPGSSFCPYPEEPLRALSRHLNRRLWAKGLQEKCILDFTAARATDQHHV